MTVHQRGGYTPVAVVLLVFLATTGSLIAVQGWNTRIPAFDLLLDIDNAHSLVNRVQVPDRGVLTSFASYSPPGVSWLMALGVSLFSDPRLIEYPATVLLYSGTLLGIFLVARLCFGMPSAILAAAVYAFSNLGLHVAHTLWHKYPLHFFYVWIIYCLLQWVIRRGAGYLAGSIFIWIVGMYVYMEIAPAIVILPILGFLYRSPANPSAVLVATLLGLAVWYPFLRFEAKRDLVDLRSQILRERILPAGYSAAWCDPTLPLRDLADEALILNTRPPSKLNGSDLPSSVLVTLLNGTAARAAAIVRGLSFNFESERAAQIPGVAVFLTVLLLSSLSIVAASEYFTASSLAGPPSSTIRALGLTGLAMIAIGLAANEFTVARYLSIDGVLEASTVSALRVLELFLVIMGLMLWFLRRRLVVGVRWLAAAIGRKRRITVLALSLVIPWIILLLVTETERMDRTWWVWPLQAIFLAAAVTYVPTRLGFPRRIQTLGSVVLLSAVSLHPMLIERASAWVEEGWSGPQSNEVQIVSYIAGQIRAHGEHRAAIGYQMPIWNYMATFNIADPRYKVGAQFDLLFKYRHGVSNTDQCAEGQSSDDEFRIVQTTVDWTDLNGKGAFDTRANNSFTLVKHFGSYQVLQRK